jgi:hypothetical protein
MNISVLNLIWMCFTNAVFVKTELVDKLEIQLIIQQASY